MVLFLKQVFELALFEAQAVSLKFQALSIVNKHAMRLPFLSALWFLLQHGHMGKELDAKMEQDEHGEIYMTVSYSKQSGKDVARELKEQLRNKQ